MNRLGWLELVRCLASAAIRKPGQLTPRSIHTPVLLGHHPRQIAAIALRYWWHRQ